MGKRRIALHCSGHRTEPCCTRSLAARAIPRRMVVLTTGSACTGLGTDMMAVAVLAAKYGLHVKHEFACDSLFASKMWIKHNFQVGNFFDDVQSSEFGRFAGYVDLFCSGFPCQPFSAQGKQQGVHDEKGRGTVIYDILQYIERHRPRMILLENVRGLFDRHADTLLEILERLKSIKDENGRPVYVISWKIMNSIDYGHVPQSRDRLYIIGYKYDRVNSTTTFAWPKKCKKRVSLKDVLSKPSTRPRKLQYPTAPRAARIVKEIVRDLKREGINPLKVPVVIDCDSSKSRWFVDQIPCLTASRAAGGGFWVTCKNGRFSIHELMRLQGIDYSKFVRPRTVSKSKLRFMIGNAFTQTVIQTLIESLLVSSGSV
eukprot:6288121-Pyramimonas_sp.AAC.1